MEEAHLLLSYARDGSEAAFRELVQREVGLVYSAALRQVGGNRALAEEVTQAVFRTLAGKAKSLVSHPSLCGWLYTTTRYAATKALRAERRRKHHEAEAVRMNNDSNEQAPADAAEAWNEVSQELDSAMARLRESDRHAVLLRFFEGHSLAAVGARIGLSEEAARKRVDRALNSLRTELLRRGVVCSVASLAGGLGYGAIVAVPGGVVAAASGAALAASGAGVVAAGTVFAMNKITVASIAAGLAVGVTLYTRHEERPGPRLPEDAAAIAPLKFPDQRPAAPATDEARPSAGSDAHRASTVGTQDMAALIAQERALFASRAAAAREVSAAKAESTQGSPVDATRMNSLDDARSAVAFFRGMSAAEKAEHLQYLITLPDSQRKEMLIPALFEAWTEIDSSGALAAATQAGGRVVRWALDGWGRNNLKAAWDWAGEYDHSNRVVNRSSAATSAFSDVRAAELGELILALPPSDGITAEQLGWELGRNWAAQSPTAASQWLRRFERNHPEEVGMAASSVGRGASSLPVEEFSRLVESQSASTGDSMVSGAVMEWVRLSELEKVREFAQANPAMSELRRDRILGAMGIILTREDPDTALATFLQIKEVKERDRHLGNGAAMVGGASVEKAMAFAVAITDPAQRSARATQAYRRWLVSDSEAARTFLARGQLDPELAKKLREISP